MNNRVGRAPSPQLGQGPGPRRLRFSAFAEEKLFARFLCSGLARV